jgi:hypothetical protein
MTKERATLHEKVVVGGRVHGPEAHPKYEKNLIGPATTL